VEQDQRVARARLRDVHAQAGHVYEAVLDAIELRQRNRHDRTLPPAVRYARDGMISIRPQELR